MTNHCPICQKPVPDDYYNRTYCSHACYAEAKRQRSRISHPQYYMSKPMATRKPTAKLRTCLGGCGRLFMSDYAGNRVCGTCRSKNSHLSSINGCYA